jgi:hypothetical protein
MADYDKKVQPPERDPYENIPISPIEKDKKGKEEYPKRFPDDSNKPHIFAALLSFFKKMASSLGFKGGGEESTFVGSHQLFEHLGAFRSQLRILTQQDESYNPEFTQQLSELWHNLIDDCNSVSTSLDISSSTKNNIKFLISQISHYPPGADHTLGFYFDAYAGKDWTPFPFMDMLKQLYQEHQDTPLESHLSKWLFLLDNILSWDQEEEKQ